MDYPPPLPGQPGAATTTRRGPKGTRTLGWVRIVIGLSLCAGMAYLFQYFQGLAVQSDLPGSRTHWHASPAVRQQCFQLVAAIFVFGLLGALAGGYQVRTGRVSQWLNGLLFVAMIPIFYVAYRLYTGIPAQP